MIYKKKKDKNKKIMTNINLFIENTYSDFFIDEKLIYDNTLKMTNYILSQQEIVEKSCLVNRSFSELSFDIVFVNNDEIHRINKEYRQKDSPTDVITFAIFADSPENEKFIFDDEIQLGEIIVSLDTIKSQAIENNVSFEDELYFIISHGILHLLGFDHLTQQDYDFMVENQKNAKAVI